MKKINLALAAFLAIGTAHAAIISGDTQSYGPTPTDFTGIGALPLTLAGYDGSGGALLGVILTLTGHIDTQYSASNTSDTEGSLTFAQTTSQMTLIFDGTGLVTAIPVATLAGVPYAVAANTLVPVNFGPLALGNNSNNTGQILAPDDVVTAFINGPVNFTVDSFTQTVFGTSGGNVAGGQSTMGSGTAHVDFIVADITEGTPEPASLALIGGGLTGLAYLLRRRKAA